jgi:hypothetical protein
MSVIIGLNGPSIKYDQKPNNRLHTERLYRAANKDCAFGQSQILIKSSVFTAAR